MSAHAVHRISECNLQGEALLSRGRQILRAELEALERLTFELDEHFVVAAERLIACRGSVVVTGVGKAGIVGQKFAASLSSTGTPSHFMHPVEAVHGDLGCIRPGDTLVFFSYSGETEEVTRLLPLIQRLQAAVRPALSIHGGEEPISTLGEQSSKRTISTIAVTADGQSTLGRGVDCVVPLGRHAEACALGLAPSCTTTLMLAISDALALVTSEARGFTKQHFAALHPAGNLGARLAKVTDVMRPLRDCRVASEESTVREAFVRMSRPGRRTGAIMLVGRDRRLSGIFTDSDLARILERQQDDQLNQPVSQVMSRHYHTVGEAAYLSEALKIMSQHKISELPVVDQHHQPIGLVDITDVVDTPSLQPNPHREDGDFLPLAAGSWKGLPRIVSLIKYQKELR